MVQTLAETPAIEVPPAELLARLGKDPRLVDYGGGNFGMPLDLLEPAGDLIVPTERFFVRSNGPVPKIDSRRLATRIGGHVGREHRAVAGRPDAGCHRAVTAFLECAGNGRTRFRPLPPRHPLAQRRRRQRRLGRGPAGRGPGPGGSRRGRGRGRRPGRRFSGCGAACPSLSP